MRSFLLGSLALSCTLLPAPAHAGGWRDQVVATLKVKGDAIRSALTGGGRRYGKGSVIVLTDQRGDTRDARIFEVGERNRVALAERIVERKSAGRTQYRSHETWRDRETTREVLHADPKRLDHETTTYADARRRTPLKTTAVVFRGDTKPSVWSLDHTTGMRKTAIYGSDGSRTITHSQVTKDANGLPSEEIISQNRFPAGR